MTLTLLAGCGSKPRLPGAQKDERPPPVVLEVQAPGPLAELLREHLDLARLPAMTQEPLREGEIDRLVAAAPAQARALVRTEGYFNAEIAVENLGGDPPRVRVTVQPGPRAIVGDVQLDVQGPLREHAERGEPNALEAQQALRREWPLPPGAPFVDETWSRAKTQSLARLRAQGYVGADWTQTQARVDAATNRVALTGRIDSGPLYRTGPLRIQGLNHHDEQTVRNIANFPPGKPATEELLLDFQERLQASSLFDRATVSLDERSAGSVGHAGARAPGRAQAAGGHVRRGLRRQRGAARHGGAHAPSPFRPPLAHAQPARGGGRAADLGGRDQHAHAAGAVPQPRGRRGRARGV